MGARPYDLVRDQAGVKESISREASITHRKSMSLTRSLDLRRAANLNNGEATKSKIQPCFA